MGTADSIWRPGALTNLTILVQIDRSFKAPLKTRGCAPGLSPYLRPFEYSVLVPKVQILTASATRWGDAQERHRGFESVR